MNATTTTSSSGRCSDGNVWVQTLKRCSSDMDTVVVVVVVVGSSSSCCCCNRRGETEGTTDRRKKDQQIVVPVPNTVLCLFKKKYFTF